jgi:hypothetical protein
LNTSNGKAKEGAVFDLGGTVAGADALQPGALTNPFVIRLQLVDPEKMPGIRLKATGMVPAGPVSKTNSDSGGAGRKNPYAKEHEPEEPDGDR